MGCNAAKNVAVIPVDGNTHSSNGAVNTDRHGASPNYIDLEPGEIENAMVNNVLKAGNGMSFDITFDDSEDKQPPKRIIELQEAENKEPPTLEKLQEKLEEAELRRQQFLQQRLQSANNLKKHTNHETLKSTDQSPNHLTVPQNAV